MKTKTQPTGVYTNVEELLQLRHLAKDISLVPRKKSSAAMDGDAFSRSRGRGMEFAEVRAYQPGDDVRNIDWRVTARTQKPYTKLFQEEKERPVFLVVDQRSPMFFGSQNVFKSVYAAQIAAILAWSANQNNDRIGAMVFGDNEHNDLRAKRGKHAVLGLLNKLQMFNGRLQSPNQPSEYTCTDIINDVRRVAKPGSSVFIISDFHDFEPDSEKPLSLLSRHSDTHLVKVFDPLERQLPGSQISVSNGSQRLKILAGSKDLYRRFHEAFEQHEHFIRKACSNTKALSFRADASLPVQQWVADVFLSHNRH
ncbi:MAG: DUF58 domain-containing protein [Cellvibrionaceae bacterium]|nr:DUF58 domain-containing protein [Cellvibrionaceae bacterium]